ncbi:hypothetical protein [Leifsonia aquatica]|uniref:hypothetical protein n=1 Tax=Leifsonia aquatica TaxID=144185 RepID=UPI0004695668|nr:hypothetical protein [Leifsonia aquatica]
MAWDSADEVNDLEPIFDVAVLEEEDDEEPIARTEPAEVPEKLPQSPNWMVNAARSMSWDVRIDAYMLYIPAVLFKHANDNHAAGDVRYAAKEHLVLEIGARLPDRRARLGFKAVYYDGKYQWSEVADPVGIFRELRYDYTPSANELKRVKDEPEWAWKARVKRMEIIAGQQEYDYNDGAEQRLHRAEMKNATELKTWMNQWVAQLAKPVEKPKRTTKKKENEAA